MQKIVVGYPPYPSSKGTPQVSQNRQFNWNKSGTVIYPVVMAQTATMLKNEGFNVRWLDGIASGDSWDEYICRLISFEPDLILWEVKTPVIKKTWEYIEEVKTVLPNCKIILCGDHVTALPLETYTYSQVDSILIGGDYDRLLRKYLKLSPEYQPKLIDRRLTRYELYANKNGNFKYQPGSYTMFARDCVHRRDGGCTFCSWTNLYRNYSVRSTTQAMDEIEELSSLGVKEVFDDSGTFPTGAWMHDFCEKLRRFNRGKHKIRMGCNMRSGVLQREDWWALAESGFRLILLGFESANKFTLEKLNKGYSVDDVSRSFQLASGAGLDVHATAMVGFPWETREDAEKTIGFAKDLFKRGHAKTIQATVCVPYPGTKLFKQCEDNHWLITRDWDRYDQSEAIMRVEGYDPVQLAKGIYRSCITPSFLLRALRNESPMQLIRKAGYLWNHMR